MSLRRAAKPTIDFIDRYCEGYQDLFAEVRSYESFKGFHLGLFSDLPRKTIPSIAKVVDLEDFQGLHHFLSESPWQCEQVTHQRLSILKKDLGDRQLTLCIDETGDRKKGSSTDYVQRQYIGNLEKVDNGIVCKCFLKFGIIARLSSNLCLNLGEFYHSRKDLED